MKLPEIVPVCVAVALIVPIKVLFIVALFATELIPNAFSLVPVPVTLTVSELVIVALSVVLGGLIP